MPGDRCLLFPPGYGTVFKTESYLCFKLCIQPNILKLKQAIQKLSYWHILQNKNRRCTCSEMLNTPAYFYKHSIQSFATLPVAVANASKPQLLQVCRWCWGFTEPAWNLSIRSKATWVKSFLMLIAYCKQIIQNQGKTVERAVTTNMCWWEELLRTFSFGHHSRQSSE